MSSLLDLEDPEYANIVINRYVMPRHGVYLECDSRIGYVFMQNRFRSTLTNVYLGKPEYRRYYVRIVRF